MNSLVNLVKLIFKSWELVKSHCSNRYMNWKKKDQNLWWAGMEWHHEMICCSPFFPPSNFSVFVDLQSTQYSAFCWCQCYLFLTILIYWLLCLRTWPGSTWTRQLWCGMGMLCQDRMLWASFLSRCHRASSKFTRWIVSQFMVSGGNLKMRPAKVLLVILVFHKVEGNCVNVKQSITFQAC